MNIPSPFQPFCDKKVTDSLLLQMTDSSQEQLSENELDSMVQNVYQSIAQFNHLHADIMANLLAYADHLRSFQQQQQQQQRRTQHLPAPTGQSYAQSTVDDLLFGSSSQPVTRDDEFHAALTTHHYAIQPQLQLPRKVNLTSDDVTSYPTAEMSSIQIL